jgi:hypothetical protein
MHGVYLENQQHELWRSAELRHSAYLGGHFHRHADKLGHNYRSVELSYGAHLGDDHHQIHGSAELGHGADLALVPPRILSSHELDLKKQLI